MYILLKFCTLSKVDMFNSAVFFWNLVCLPKSSEFVVNIGIWTSSSTYDSGRLWTVVSTTSKTSNSFSVHSNKLFKSTTTLKGVEPVILSSGRLAGQFRITRLAL